MGKILHAYHARVSRSKDTKSPPSTFATPDARFNQVHIDIVGKLFTSNGLNNILTCINRFTRWHKAVTLTDITAETVAHAFIHTVPGYLNLVFLPVSTDRGRQFKSALWNQLM